MGSFTQSKPKIQPIKDTFKALWKTDRIEVILFSGGKMFQKLGAMPKKSYLLEPTS